MAFTPEVYCTVTVSPGKAGGPGKAPVILRGGKAVRPRLGLEDGHQVMNPLASVKACCRERAVYDKFRFSFDNKT